MQTKTTKIGKNGSILFYPSPPAVAKVQCNKM